MEDYASTEGLREEIARRLLGQEPPEGVEAPREASGALPSSPGVAPVSALAEASEPLELEAAISVIRDALRRRQIPFLVKIKGVTSSAQVRQALVKVLRERLSHYWAAEEVERYCENLKVELHGVEKDGNWYDVFARPRE